MSWQRLISAALRIWGWNCKFAIRKRKWGIFQFPLWLGWGFDFHSSTWYSFWNETLDCFLAALRSACRRIVRAEGLIVSLAKAVSPVLCLWQRYWVVCSACSPRWGADESKWEWNMLQALLCYVNLFILFISVFIFVKKMLQTKWKELKESQDSAVMEEGDICCDKYKRRPGWLWKCQWVRTGREYCKTAVEVVMAGHSPVAGAYFDVTQILIFGELAVHMRMATGLKWEAYGEKKISTVTLVAGSLRTKADVCPWASAFCLVSKNTDSVNFLENCWHWCILVEACFQEKSIRHNFSVALSWILLF